MTKNIRVLAAPCGYILNDSRTESMGAINFSLLRELGRLDVSITALTMKADLATKIANCRIIELLPETKLTQMSILQYVTRYSRVGKKLLDEEGFDLVHHMLPFGWEIGYNPLLLGGYTRGKPFILGPVLAPHAQSIAIKDEKIVGKSYENKKSAVSLNERVGNLIFNSALRFGKNFAFQKFKKTLEMADWVVASDNHTRDCFLKYVPESKISVIRTGIDTKSIKPLADEIQKAKKNPDEVEILAAGYLSERKGIRYLIEGFAQLVKKYPKIRLKIVGYGPASSDLRRLAKNLGVSKKIDFTGSFKEHAKVIENIQSCDIFCLPALSETWVAIQEAMACGKPIVTTDIGSHPEHVPDGKVGFLVPPQNSQAIADTCEKLILNPDRRKAMGVAARHHIEENYDWEKIAVQYVGLYETLIKVSNAK